MKKIIYMDNAATTSTSRAALDAMIPVLEREYGNPSSLHQLGQQAADLLADARKRVPALVHSRMKFTLHRAVPSRITGRSLSWRRQVPQKERNILFRPRLSITQYCIL